MCHHFISVLQINLFTKAIFLANTFILMAINKTHCATLKFINACHYITEVCSQVFSYMRIQTFIGKSMIFAIPDNSYQTSRVQVVVISWSSTADTLDFVWHRRTNRMSVH